MRKLNGITINGEYLGNSVVINGMFRAICTISPVIMRDFVLIINKIERLEEAVKIHNFNCGFDCIDIEFENKTSKGMASLYFKLRDGEPMLKDCKLVIDNQEYSTFQDKIQLRSNKQKDMTNPGKTAGTQGSELDRLQKIRELREKKQAMQRQQTGAGIGNQNSNMVKQSSSALNKANLSPEQQREQKRQELLEKKRRLLEAKKSKTSADTISNEEQSKSVTNTINDTEENTSSSASSSTQSVDSKQQVQEQKPISIVTQPDGSITNEKGQTVVKEERVNPDGTISEVYVNPENPEEVYEQNENGEFVCENPPQEDIYEKNEYSEGVNEEDYMQDDYIESGGSLLENLSDEDLENMSDEELAALEAELNAELGEDVYATDSYSSGGGYQTPDFNMNGFAERLAQGLTEGLTLGLSQGLAQGLSQGFGGMANMGGGLGNGAGTGNSFGGGSFGDSFGDGFNGGGQGFTAPQVQQVFPDYSQIDNMNEYASMSARDSYSYDENSNADDISDFYSDFYDEVQQSNSGQQIQQETSQGTDENAPMSELDALKAELEALKAQSAHQKDLMTLDEFMAKQKELNEAKEKARRQKLKIIGSQGNINASALDGGVFVAGKKIYKWGDTRVLDE